MPCPLVLNPSGKHAVNRTPAGYFCLDNAFELIEGAPGLAFETWEFKLEAES
jgi:hypothetical protein